MAMQGSDAMWCLVMFDLPVSTKQERSEATRFRNHLMDLGFCRVQFSVYVQYLPLAARLSTIVKQIKQHLPMGGDIRIVNISDIQWSKGIRFSKEENPVIDDPPSQLLIF